MVITLNAVPSKQKSKEDSLEVLMFWKARFEGELKALNKKYNGKFTDDVINKYVDTDYFSAQVEKCYLTSCKNLGLEKEETKAEKPKFEL